MKRVPHQILLLQLLFFCLYLVGFRRRREILCSGFRIVQEIGGRRSHFELRCLVWLNVVRMEALSAGNELGLAVSAAINLGGEEHETITLRSSNGLLSATLVDLKEKCMEVLGAHLQRHSVPLDEPDLDALDETFEEDEDTNEEPVEGAAPPKKKKKAEKK